MLAGVECLDDVRSVVDVGDFYSPRHTAIFSTLGELAAQGGGLGPILVAAELVDSPYPLTPGS